MAEIYWIILKFGDWNLIYRLAAISSSLVLP